MSTKTKTFEECCDDVANENYGREFAFYKTIMSFLNERDVAILNKSVELYASEKIKEKEHEKNQQIDNIIKKLKKQEFEKIKRAIELARECHTNEFFDKGIEFEYTEQGILELLNQNK